MDNPASLRARLPFVWESESGNALWLILSHHQRETWWSWIQLGRLSPDTIVIKQTAGEEMRTSTPAAASALSSVALSPSCQSCVDVKWGGKQIWVFWHFLCNATAMLLKHAGLKVKFHIVKLCGQYEAMLLWVDAVASCGALCKEVLEKWSFNLVHIGYILP